MLQVSRYFKSLMFLSFINDRVDLTAKNSYVLTDGFKIFMNIDNFQNCRMSAMPVSVMSFLLEVPLDIILDFTSHTVVIL